jgi:hypothetical protein
MPAAACASLARYRTVRWTISLTAPRICASALGRQSEVLMVCLLADWLDLGLARMAEPCTASPGQIAFTAAWPHQTYAPGAAPLGQSATAQAPGRAVRQRHGGVLRQSSRVGGITRAMSRASATTRTTPDLDHTLALCTLPVPVRAAHPRPEEPCLYAYCSDISRKGAPSSQARILSTVSR